jgi:hypothetical protein
MADKVTGNPYEHKQSRRCETPFSPCSQNSNTCCIGCPNLHVECLKDCPACIWEVAYKAGQKSVVEFVYTKGFLQFVPGVYLKLSK